MADKETITTLDTNQVAATEPPATPVTPGPGGSTDSTVATFLYPPSGPNPSGAAPANAQKRAQEAEVQGEETPGTPGTEAEQVIWEARYSMKNFIGRITFRALLTLGWIALLVSTWGENQSGWQLVAILTGLVVGVLWIGLLYRIIMARYGHYYRLTNRRLFVSTGVMRRRRDQMELLRVEDVFTRQTLFERWLSVGTVVVVSSESQLSTFYLAGVDDPKQVMDLVWNYARAERTGKAVQVDQI
jgi:membrane protein YdbS with pleckstrin-like domain